MRGKLLLVIGAGTLTATGCDAFSAQSNVVASAAGRRLDTDRMVAMLTAMGITPIMTMIMGTLITMVTRRDPDERVSLRSG